MNDCKGRLHPRAIAGLRLFNSGQYFEAHEALEEAWNEEQGPVRDLYRGILQAAVVYLHITRGNYAGAMKVHERSKKWLKDWPAVCRGVQVGQLRNDLESAVRTASSLKDGASKIDPSRLRPVAWEEPALENKQEYLCDRCGHEMYAFHCRIICPNCGNQFDCSDLNFHID